MLKAFQEHIDQNLPFLKNSKLLLAISGGIDSVVLAHLCYQSNIDFKLAHCNFKLRAEESDADEHFVTSLAETFDIEVFVEHFNTEDFAKEHKLSIQMAARDLRYTWFYKLAEHFKFNYILTAHHLDDSLETFLINLSRGTGLNGLIGIPENNQKLVRPLLPFTRDDIFKYATDHNLQYREDSSNTSTKYLRNALRHDVIPKLKALTPQFLENFKQTQEHLQESRVIIDNYIDSVSNNILDYKSDGIYVDIKKLLKLHHPKAYLYEFFKDYGFTQWDDIYNLLTAQAGKYIISSSHRIIKDRNYLIVCSNENTSNNKQIIEEKDTQIVFNNNKLVLSYVESIDDGGKNVAYFDKNKVTFPLVLRRWQDGDSFQPTGMQGSKKLSKYFKDEKLSLIEKENVWLLCSGEDILWIIGRRQDRRYVISDETTGILKIELH